MGHDGGVPRLVYRPTFVRVLSLITWVVLAAGLVLTAVDDPASGLRWLPFVALGATVVYVLFWRPSVEVDDDAVTVRNLVRDVRVPWERLDSVDTRYALTLHSGDRKVSAWAAPAPGRAAALRQSRRDAQALAALGTNLDHGLTSSEAPNSDSGGASLMVRARWEAAQSTAAERRRRSGATGPEPQVARGVALVPVALLAVTVAASVLALLV